MLRESEEAARINARAAIVHDWFQGYHGAERVVDAMRTGLFADENPPDILTFHAAHEVIPPELARAITKESRLARLPGIRQRGHDPGRWRYLLPYMPHYFSRLPLTDYEVVVSSSHACAVNVRPRKDAVHVCYCYTPMRYAWMPETERHRVGGVKALALGALAGRLRRSDLAASRRLQSYVAISTAVCERIRAFYGRDATVIHPPVDVDDFHPSHERDGDRFLWVNRLVSYKHPETVVEAFRGLPYRLTMVGVGPLEDGLRRDLPPNVELLPWLERGELIRLYERSTGFIHIGEEDFGMTMVEALAAGTPVIALDRGGARDIVRAERDGVLLDQPDVEKLRRAVHDVAEARFDPQALARRARQFSRERFLEQMRSHVAELLATPR